MLLASSLFTASVLVSGPVDQQSAASAAAMSGTWRARLSETWTRRDGERWVSLNLQRDGDHNYGTSVRQSELEAAGIRGESFSGSNVHFSLPRAAGRFEFEGSFDSGRGGGTFRFTPNGAFIASLQKTGRQVSSDDALRLALHDVDQAFIASIEAAGYKGVSIEDLIKMRIHGVDADYIGGLRKAGYTSLSVEDLDQDPDSRRHSGLRRRDAQRRLHRPVHRRPGEDPDPRRDPGVHAGGEGRGLRAALGRRSREDADPRRVRRLHPPDARPRPQGPEHRRHGPHADPRRQPRVHERDQRARLPEPARSRISSRCGFTASPRNSSRSWRRSATPSCRSTTS